MRLATQWLEDHQHCTTQQYFESVAPLMPKHISRGRHKASGIALAKEALRELVSRGRVSVNDHVCTITKKQSESHGELWRKLATDRVIVRDVASEHELTKSQEIAFRQWLRNNCYRSDGNGVYTKPEGLG